jgi:SAM-dependent methyltransferase
MLNRIAQAMPYYDSVNEMGCGIGSITKQLLKYPQAEGRVFTATDINMEMIRLTKQNLGVGENGRTSSGMNVHFNTHDIREPYVLVPLSGKHIVHSHGVLEHFDDNDIRNIIETQRSYANLIFHYVPSDKYTSKSFGDERLMSAQQWAKLAKPTMIEQFNSGYDLLLIWRR